MQRLRINNGTSNYDVPLCTNFLENSIFKGTIAWDTSYCDGILDASAGNNHYCALQSSAFTISSSNISKMLKYPIGILINVFNNTYIYGTSFYTVGSSKLAMYGVIIDIDGIKFNETTSKNTSCIKPVIISIHKSSSSNYVIRIDSFEAYEYYSTLLLVSSILDGNMNKIHLFFVNVDQVSL